MKEAFAKIRSEAGSPTFIACKGKELNIMIGADLFPDDHTFEIDLIKSTLTDVTLGKVFNI